ncbi:MAG: peroxiredoxin [Flavobacteriales bacterium]|jgi:peroxiredoxin Q/BCP|tara:strand:+ start:2112 stop:2558 length:447 start_codon:yes stop_codon:yes gene_type:complete
MSLKVGDRIPHFELLNQHGELFKSETVLGVKPLVVYFYPKDETPGCTAEACSFRDHYEEFLELGAEVIGISSDGVKSHQKFATRHKLPFVLLSDSKKKVQRLFKLPKILFGLFTKRITFVIDKDGLVSYVHSSLMPDTHIKKALQQLK